jgi:hypothetical protein
MFHRAGYAVILKCNLCGTIGSATFKEKEDAPHLREDLKRQIVRIEGKFRPGIGRDPNIYCSQCGKPVV